ncbi:hypothetical protein BV25DRAFT_523845 [Artomyces pyxidatus]|uniref:Uncharacterized protein n=1 Tax=Artomyces pyxidatus TaxID=48021 RepID=A0ACB8TIB8_9AGAM|nr:hypothetical protein BV25DRAFT_523845 [Artomyces pyxidatus]
MSGYPYSIGYLAPAFAALLILGGQVGLPILVLTCFISKRLHKHATIINFCITMIIYSVVFCLLSTAYSATPTQPLRCTSVHGHGRASYGVGRGASCRTSSTVLPSEIDLYHLPSP